MRVTIVDDRSCSDAGFLPANAFAFDALGRGWRGKVAERMSDALTKLG